MLVNVSVYVQVMVHPDVENICIYEHSIHTFSQRFRNSFIER